ncbi:hypothetical protein B0H17DRAFT_1187719 [Mycena rosella]|uniref:Uncharacterized protein n=1 Tax=Mycena rosella TaxID=1033263 RepID=A0AAD7FM06_MYCRO|nr:hypothetical protein B0H17DRAFT_1187719 [Mycena rosella]
MKAQAQGRYTRKRHADTQQTTSARTRAQLPVSSPTLSDPDARPRAALRAQRRAARDISSARLEAKTGMGDKEEESKETIGRAGKAFPSGKNEVKSRNVQQKNGPRSTRQPPGSVKRECDDQREPPLTKAPLRYRHVHVCG